MKEKKITFLVSEYFCKDCLQLRGSMLKKPKTCFNCNSERILVGNPYELDKEGLLESYRK